ncbi:MAG: histidine kinase dimerization/phospho-acceptor domain-containing protein, partial [Planctomycetota bacterium]
MSDSPPPAASTTAEAKRAQADLAALRGLLAVMAHDLSNPLQSLTVLLELSLEDLATTHPAHAKLDQCLDAAQRMRGMVRDLSGFARTSTRRLRSPTIGSV